MFHFENTFFFFFFFFFSASFCCWQGRNYSKRSVYIPSHILGYVCMQTHTCMHRNILKQLKWQTCYSELYSFICMCSHPITQLARQFFYCSSLLSKYFFELLWAGHLTSIPMLCLWWILYMVRISMSAFGFLVIYLLVSNIFLSSDYRWWVTSSSIRM